MNFANVYLVLVETTHPGNIGAAARAMKTMGLEQLILVRPSLFPHAEATARAAGGSDILARARVMDSLDAALSDCHLVIASSARRRHLPCPELTPRECAARAASYSDHSPVALVFGRERTGLTNEELDRCHFQVQIPANPQYSSLNLAAAVQILCYELRLAAVDPDHSELIGANARPASADEMSRFYEHLEQVLVSLGFIDPANPRHTLRRLRRLFNRALPDQNEINILRGILTAVQDSQKPSRQRS